MADSMNPTEQRIMKTIAQDTNDLELDRPEEVVDRQPVYKVIGESKRPTSKHHGPLWRSRKDAAYSKLDRLGYISNWDEAIRYYKNDQRKGRQGTAAKTRGERLGQGSEQDSENIVFANTSALVPAIYAKNPSCEVTPNIRDDNEDDPTAPDDTLRRVARVAQRLANILSGRKGSPGINLKPKARRAVVMSTLTNISYLEVGYTFKENSSEEALADLDRIATELAAAKDQKEIERLEGELLALEEKIDFLRPAGPWVKFRHPKDVLRDPDSTEADLSDCQWVMISDYVATAYINAVYRDKKAESTDEWVSIYKPTHVVGTQSVNGVQEEINNFSILKDNLDYRAFGYNDHETYQKALRTKVWYVWDKVTRRVYMYNDQDWSWPIWVWDDFYNLDTFFPVFPLEFYTDPEEGIGNSEVMYYLDQQDAINEVNGELAKIRRRIIGTVFYNKNVIRDATAIDAYVNGAENDKAVGVDAPADANLQQAFFALVPPSVQFIQLLDKRQYYEAAARVSSVQPVMQGQQFKTNTTNEAIETYNSNQQTRLDEKIDAVEDCIGAVLWAVIQMCLQFMTKEEVATLLGPKDANDWVQMNAQEIRRNFSARVVGGSTQKPTSRVKKQEAIQMAQTIGQFGQAGGGAVVLLILKVMERAFDELTVTTEDWEFLRNMITQNVANSNPTGNPAQAGAEAAPQAPEGAQAPDQMTQIAELVNQLPEEAKQALGTALARGVPIQEALPRIIEMVQQAASGPVQ